MSKNTNLLSAELLIDLYIVQKMSIPQIANKLSVGRTSVLNYLKKYNIPRRKLSESLTGKSKSAEHRSKLSESRKGDKNPNFGKKISSTGKRCWYTCPDGRTVSMRSQWEVWYAEYLRENNIPFEYEQHTFNLEDGSAYTPDFYLVNSDEYIEVKGWLTLEHQNRVALFRKTYPDKTLILADKNYLQNLGIDLRRKWLFSKPQFPCDKCGKSYHRSYPSQRFCSVLCRNGHNRWEADSSSQEKQKRRYRGSQSGELNNSSKIKKEQVLEVRRLHSLGATNADIARQLGITPGNISNIVRGRSWKDVK